MQVISFLFMHHDSVEAEICFQSCPLVSMQEEDYDKTTRLIIRNLAERWWINTPCTKYFPDQKRDPGRSLTLQERALTLALEMPFYEPNSENIEKLGEMRIQTAMICKSHNPIFSLQ